MSRSTRFSLSYEPADISRPYIIHDELIDWIEAGSSGLVTDTLPSGYSMTIPAQTQYIVYESIDIIGSLTIAGKLVIL